MYGTPQFAHHGPGTYYLGAPLSTRRRRRRLSGLGSLTADQATEQVFPAAQVRSSAGHNQSVRDQILASVNAGQILNAQGSPDYIPGSGQCSATGVSSNLKLAQTSAGLALTGTSIGLVAAGVVTSAALAPFTLGISALIGLFPIFFGHHAQAVKKEQSVLCTAVPAANNYLQVIDQGVQSGQFTAQQGIDALNSLLSDFGSQVSSIRNGNDPTSSGQCNAACVEYSKLRAIVIFKSSQYQDLAAQQAAQAANPIGAAAQTISAALAPVTGAVQSVEAAASSAGLPTWALPAAGFFLLWKLI
jgi:hypothetical protein